MTTPSPNHSPLPPLPNLEDLPEPLVAAAEDEPPADDAS